MDFDVFLARCWDDHATDPPGVAERLQLHGPALLSQAAQIVPLANLVHHVFGQHLGRWQEGIQFQQRLATLPSCPADETTLAALQRFSASLSLASGATDARAALGASDHARISAMAAASLAEHDTARALSLFQEALTAATGLPDSDPCVRALAVAGNNLAGTLAEKTERNADERQLMILAAQTGRRCWALAGGWLEIERAEYRLALTWAHAGDPAQARQHAQHCLQLVQAHGDVALERFFGWEAMACAERAAGDAGAWAQAVLQAETAFADLDESDRGGCQASLDKLRL